MLSARYGLVALLLTGSLAAGCGNSTTQGTDPDASTDAAPSDARLDGTALTDARATDATPPGPDVGSDAVARPDVLTPADVVVPPDAPAMCTATCSSDLDCVRACPAMRGAAQCCDRGTGTCFAMPGMLCPGGPPPPDGGGMYL